MIEELVNNLEIFMDIKKLAFMSACKDFFGLKEGQTSMSFAQEVKALTPEDRAEITKGLEQNGYEIIGAA